MMSRRELVDTALEFVESLDKTLPDRCGQSYTALLRSVEASERETVRCLCQFLLSAGILWAIESGPRPLEKPIAAGEPLPF